MYNKFIKVKGGDSIGEDVTCYLIGNFYHVKIKDYLALICRKMHLVLYCYDILLFLYHSQNIKIFDHYMYLVSKLNENTSLQ